MLAGRGAAGGGSGKGLAVNNKTGKETFMKMIEIQAGLGMGIKKFRLIWVFENQSDFKDFITSGWEFGGQADAAAKARDKGVAATGEFSIDAETTMYTMSEAGLMAKVNLAGTKYWKDSKLNY